MLFNPKLTDGLQHIVYAFYFLVYASGNYILKIFFSILLLAYLIVHYYDSKYFFSFLENNKTLFRVEPKEFFSISTGLIFKVIFVLVFMYLAYTIFQVREGSSSLSELYFISFPLLLQVVTQKSNKAKGYYYFSDAGVFLPANQNTLIDWDEIEKFGNNPEKDHFEFYLRNQDSFYVKKVNAGSDEFDGDEEFIESFLSFALSKLKPKQILS